MKQFIKRFSLLICCLIFLPVLSQAQESGFLLGLRYTKSQADGTIVPAYRTLWIAPQNGKISLVAEAENLIVPRKTGFWRIGVKRNIYKSWHEDFIWAIKEPNPTPDESQQVKKIDSEIGENSEGGTFHTILFVGNDYISVETRSGGYTRGAAHGWQFDSLSTIALERMIDFSPVKISDILGNDGSKALQRGAMTLFNTLSEKKKETLDPEPGEAWWGLIRRKGQWVLRGRLSYSAEVFRGEYADFDIPLAPPKALVSHDTLYPTWATIKKSIPDAIDAFTSPQKDLLVVLTRTSCFAFSLNRGKFTEPAMRLKLRENEAAVMSQWAIGKHVERWTQQILASNPPQDTNVPVFHLTGKLEFADGTITGPLKKTDIDGLLNRPLKDELTLTNDQNAKITVHTCREWYEATQKGYYAMTTVDMVMESSFRKICDTLDALFQASLPQKSFIANPKVGLTALHLLSLSLLPTGLTESEEGDPILNQAVASGATVQDWVHDGKVSVLSKSQDTISLEYKGTGRAVMLSELVRADFNADGIEDILAFSYDYPIDPSGGTFREGTVLLLTRLGEDQPFQLIKGK